MPPPAGNVHGLGLVDALRIEVKPVQLAWLADEIEVVRSCLEDKLAHQRARFDEMPDVEKEQGSARAREARQELERRDAPRLRGPERGAARPRPRC